MNVRLSKIKLKDRRIFISWEKYEEKTESWDEYSMRSADPALPSLYEALGKLDHHIAEICELPKECEQTIEATGVSFSYDDEGGRGCVITGKKLLQSNPAPVNLNTPYKAENPQEGLEEYALSKDCVKILNELEQEAFAYINGDRAQGKLFQEESMTPVEASAMEAQQEEIFH